jgi:hypothetical protein
MRWARAAVAAASGHADRALASTLTNAGREPVAA